MKKIKHYLSILLAVLMVVFTAFSASASKIPTPTDAFYVNDYANVLSTETKNYIAEHGYALARSTDAEIVVVTIDFLGGTPIDEYALKLFNNWALGDKLKNNGLLILLVIGEEDYYVTSGDGLSNHMPVSLIKRYLNDYLEEDFAAARYDAGVRKVYDKFFLKVQSIYSSSPTSTTSSSNTGDTIAPELILWIIVIPFIFLFLRGGKIFFSWNDYDPQYHTSYRDADPPPVYYSNYDHNGGYYISGRSYSSNWESSSSYSSNSSPSSSGYSSSSSPSKSSYTRSSSSGGGRSTGSGAGRSSGTYFGGSSSAGKSSSSYSSSHSSSSSSSSSRSSGGGSSSGGSGRSGSGGGRSSGGGAGRGKH